MRRILPLIYFTLLFACGGPTTTPINDYDRAKSAFESKNLDKSRDIILAMKEGDDGYSEAQILDQEVNKAIVTRDSLKTVEKHQHRKDLLNLRLKKYNTSLVYDTGKSEWESGSHVISDAEMMD